MDEEKEKTEMYPRPETLSGDSPITSAKVHKKINATVTQKRSFRQIQPETRQNERNKVLGLMRCIDYEVCRQELVILSGLPINHITRVTRDLIDSGMIRVARKDYSSLTGRLVELLVITDKGRA